MGSTEMGNRSTAVHRREEHVQKYWAADLSRKVYRLRRQRKAILENCRRTAVAGVNSDPESPSFVAMERLLGIGLEIIPVFPGRENLLGVRCYARLRDIPGKIDIVQIHPTKGIELMPLARDAVEKGVNTFWVEIGLFAPPQVEEVLANGNVQLVEYENLESEYLKHTMPAAPTFKKDRKAVKVYDRMTRNPISITAGETLKDAMATMERGKFRHLPVVDDQGRLIAILSDRDIRSLRSSLAFVNKEDAFVQLWSITVQQAAAFSPIKVNSNTTLKEAADLMLRWQVGGLPVIDKEEKVIGMITYTDILREFIGREENRYDQAH